MYFVGLVNVSCKGINFQWFLGGSTNRGPYDFQTEEWITKVLRFILIYSAKSLSFRFQKIGRKVYLTAAWRGSERKMSTKNGRRYMMNRSLNEILKSIKLHYKLSLSRIIFSFPIVYKQNDPWPILSFTFSHNRLLMDFSQEKWILRDLLMMLSSTNISFIFQPG